MTLNVIYTPNVNYVYDRLGRLRQELQEQGINDYKLCSGVIGNAYPYQNISKAHKNIVHKAMVARTEKCLIAEDDIRFCGAGAYQYFLDNEPKDYDLYLCGIYVGHIKKDNTVDFFSGLTMYIIHSRYYETFLASKDQNHIDSAQQGRGKFVVCNPFAAIQYNGFSFNKNKVMNYDKNLQQYKLYNNFQP